MSKRIDGPALTGVPFLGQLSGIGQRRPHGIPRDGRIASGDLLVIKARRQIVEDGRGQHAGTLDAGPPMTDCGIKRDVVSPIHCHSFTWRSWCSGEGRLPHVLVRVLEIKPYLAQVCEVCLPKSMLRPECSRRHGRFGMKSTRRPQAQLVSDPARQGEKLVSRGLSKAEMVRASNYNDPNTFHGQFSIADAPFRKQDRFSHQQEYRFAFQAEDLNSGEVVPRDDRRSLRH